MKYPLVTIISPVYNGEKYIADFIKSLIYQNYPNMELILINDGSIDNTSKIIKSFEKEIKQKFQNYIYLEQKNIGAAGAINNGLKYISGEFFTWPDSDDILPKNSVSMKAKFLMENPKYGYVRTEGLAFRENQLNKPIYRIMTKSFINLKSNLFYNFLFDRNIYFCDGCYMVRTKTFKKSNKGMEIYVTKAGQNWQMLLPISYYSKCGYLNSVGYYYIERENSHSHKQKNYLDLINKYNGYEDTICNVLNKMEILKYKYLILKIKEKYSHIRLNLAIEFNNKNDYEKEYKFLKENHKLTIEDRICFYAKNKKKVHFDFQKAKKILQIPIKVVDKLRRWLKNDKI